MTYRESRPDPEREFRVMPQEADHYRSDLRPGDIVRGQYGNLARLVAWNHTWSHLTGGRLAHLEPLVTYPGTEIPAGCDAEPFNHTGSWESNLNRAQPGDIGAHASGRGFGWRHHCATWQDYPDHLRCTSTRKQQRAA